MMGPLPPSDLGALAIQPRFEAVLGQGKSFKKRESFEPRRPSAWLVESLFGRDPVRLGSTEIAANGLVWHVARGRIG
jgi:hypothetical protein